jgi:hypothetical protein
MSAAADISYAIFMLLHFQVRASSGYCVFRLEHLQVRAFFRLERYQVRALSDAIFSSFEKMGYA